jgi:hypothetical protein
VVSENGKDGIVYNMNTVGGQASWSSLVPFEFLSGADDSFAANSLVADLDGDGLDDVLIADVDPQVSGFNRRLHIYHNRGNAPSGAAVLREERESGLATGWIGVVGLSTNELKGTHDIAVFDIDGDGLDDLLVSRNAGTQAYRRLPVCQPDLGGGDPGLTLTICGDKLSSGRAATLSLTGAIPSVPVIVLASASSVPTFVPEIQDTLLAFPPFYIGAFSSSAVGELSLPVNGGGGPFSVYVQCLAFNGAPDLFDVSNAVEAQYLN